MKIQHFSQILFTVFLTSILTSFLSAQPGVGMQQRERIEMVKTRFLTRQMEMTKEEARQFWPVYDTYQAEMSKLKSDRNDWIPKSPEAFDQMNDDEINALIDARMSQAEKAVQARKTLVQELRGFLTPRKIAIFLRAEQQFNKELQQRIKEQRGQDVPGERE